MKPVEKTEGADLPSSLAATTSSAVDGTSLAATTSSAVDGTTLAATTSAADGTSVAGTTSAAEGTSAAGTTSAVDGTSAAGTTSAGSEASTSAIGTSVESTGAVKKVKPTVESSTVEISAITSDKPAETTKVEATSETPAITSTESASGSLAEGTTAGSAATSTARHSKTGGNRTGGGKGPKQGRPQDQLETTKKPKRPAGGPELPIGGILPDQIGTDFNPFSAAAGGAAGRRPPPGPIVILRPQKPNEVEGNNLGTINRSKSPHADPLSSGPVNNGELCTSNPCRNNGTCYTDPESEYTCVCTKGWAGKECAGNA